MGQLTQPNPVIAPVDVANHQGGSRPLLGARLGSPKSRATPLSARGEPVVWLTGMAMSICIVMIVALLGITVYQGSRTFWPKPIDTLVMTDGRVVMGMPMATEHFVPQESDRAAIEKLKADAAGFIPGAFDAQGRPVRTLYRIGNKEIRGEPFEWIELYKVKSTRRDPEATLLERNNNWGLWIGVAERVERRVKPAEGSGSPVITTLAAAEKGKGLWRSIAPLHGEASDRRGQIAVLSKGEVGEINQRLERERQDFEQAKLAAARAKAGMGPAFGAGVWWAWLVMAVGLAAVAAVMTRRLIQMADRPGSVTPTRRLVVSACWVVAIGAALVAVLERPSSASMSEQELAALETRYKAKSDELNAAYQSVLDRIKEIDARDAEVRLIVRDAESGRFAPTTSTAPDEPMRLSSVVRWVEPNQLTFAGKVGVYLDRWREFVFDEPRNTNTEGGIFPVIFGTVLLTLLLSVLVVPLGVIAALYMREYAKQGVMISVVRICVNNLAGVPSIVYGVFGLGFFCYTLGAYIDRGPMPEMVVSRFAWWAGAIGLGMVVVFAVAMGLYGRPKPGREATRTQKWLMLLSALTWLAAAAGVVGLLVGTPYFHGFYEYRPAATFGTRGLLWAALTLSLLTLPVVIVATEEAIAAVPRTMREGSYGCGASKWQTIRRIVLPRAMPGIMTGMILAMARGAGEVAPLMLVGAVKLAPELLVSKSPPFLHLENSFMHLGFHIFDVGFQSPDSEAARPLVWTTTLVLVCIVLFLNLAAIRIRAKLRSKYIGGAF
ncbi:MAG: ABC transporter permease subunit [Phycisphaerales bacterium]|nr:ABC transporter permease subunit [Phycisphaerales bacterium]